MNQPSSLLLKIVGLCGAILPLTPPSACLAQDSAPPKAAVPPGEAAPDAAAPKKEDAPRAAGTGEKKKPAADDASGEVDEDAVKDIEDGYQAIERLTKAMELIRQNYVDEKKVTYDRLISSALRGMLEDLDPHCQYLAPQVFEQMKQTQENTYEGVGITISPRNDALVIVSVREDGPAARAGVLPGDSIIKIGDTLTDKLGYLEAVQMLKGKPGEKLTLTVYRSSTKETKAVEMVREVMRQDSVRDAMMLDPALTGDLKIGYVRILQFMQPTAGELAQALDGLEEKGMQALVLDLRNNPGGLLNSAVDVCGEFLPGETTVVTTEVRSGENPPPYKTKKRPKGPRDFPLVILQNHSSASGSELTAGALQDLGRAIVVGEKSFGKGSVQTIIPSRDQSGTAVRLTTAKYFTPSHKVIHEHGIVPDITATLTPEEELRIFEWRRSRAQGNADPVQLAKLGDRQLERAVTALRGVMAFRARKQQPNGQPKPVEPPKPPENPAPSPAPPSASPAPTPAPVPAPEPQKANP